MKWSATAAKSRRTISKCVDHSSKGPAPAAIGKHLQVIVRDNNVDQALRVFKKRMQREGVFRVMKRRRAYEKPSERKTARRLKPSAARVRPPGNWASAKA